MLCKLCNENKKPSEFYGKGKGRKQYCCKPCFNKYCVERWKMKKIKAVEKMGGKCADCGKSYHYSVYDFHHIKKKDYNWTKLRLRSEEDINKELSKCILLCSNCHRIRHYSE